jgi:ABC-type Zn uptake system ZnuABC Zn-binding protein ZnuA
MKRSIPLALLAALLLSLPSCGAGTAEEPRLTVVCTTFPIYLFASSLTEGVEGVAVERLDTGSTSCLHDYTLSMADMKKIERADIIAVNGAGLEEFLEDALAASDAKVIDCSQGVVLLESLSHRHDEDEEDEHGHDHGHWDPHYWMDPSRAAVMLENLAEGLSLWDSGCAGAYRANLERARPEIEALLPLAAGNLYLYPDGAVMSWVSPHRLITFHDGFQYFAEVYGFELLAAIEEEAGSEASAHEIVEITGLVNRYDIPAIFTEVNGSAATANSISRETGCQVRALNMIMDGEEAGVEGYVRAMEENLRTIWEAFQ